MKLRFYSSRTNSAHDVHRDGALGFWSDVIQQGEFPDEFAQGELVRRLPNGTFERIKGSDVLSLGELVGNDGRWPSGQRQPKCKNCVHWGEQVPGGEMCVCDSAPLYAYEKSIGDNKPTEQVNLPIATPPDFGCTYFRGKE